MGSLVIAGIVSLGSGIGMISLIRSKKRFLYITTLLDLTKKKRVYSPTSRKATSTRFLYDQRT